MYLSKMKHFSMCIATFLAIALCSCSSSKSSLTYFEDIKESVSGEFDASKYLIKIEPNDELFITVTSTYPEASAIYNLPLANPAERLQILSVTNPQQQTYIVNADGKISFPVLGDIQVAGLTTTQIKENLTKLIAADVEDPSVRVELVNFRINVLGEVKAPGAIKATSERYSILDALADAGDLTEYGERSNILLIREENGKITYHRLNLNDTSVLTSPYFYLKQNDAIYIEPNSIRKANSKYNQNNSFKISVISTIVSACSVIASLVIAFAAVK